MMLKIALGCAVAALCVQCIAQEVKLHGLEKENAGLKKRLAAAICRGRKETADTKARLHSDIGKLQMVVFQRDELIGELRREIATKDRLIQQKWRGARNQNHESSL